MDRVLELISERVQKPVEDPPSYCAAVVRCANKFPLNESLLTPTNLKKDPALSKDIESIQKRLLSLISRTAEYVESGQGAVAEDDFKNRPDTLPNFFEQIDRLCETIEVSIDEAKSNKSKSKGPVIQPARIASSFRDNLQYPTKCSTFPHNLDPDEKFPHSIPPSAHVRGNQVPRLDSAEMRALRKYNGDILLTSRNPLKWTIARASTPLALMAEPPSGPYPSFSETGFQYVDTASALECMLAYLEGVEHVCGCDISSGRAPCISFDRSLESDDHLRLPEDSRGRRPVRELAIDLEHSSATYYGFTCLVQLSTRDCDFIVDPLPLFEQLEGLNRLTTDPSVLKLFHGSENDLEWLERDFRVYVVGLFDTYCGSKALGLPQHSLKYLAKHFTGVDLDKEQQRADWRRRPLSEEMLQYARNDTHVLFEIFDKMKLEMLQRSGRSSWPSPAAPDLTDDFKAFPSMIEAFYPFTDASSIQSDDSTPKQKENNKQKPQKRLDPVFLIYTLGEAARESRRTLLKTSFRPSHYRPGLAGKLVLRAPSNYQADNGTDDDGRGFEFTESFPEEAYIDNGCEFLVRLQGQKTVSARASVSAALLEESLKNAEFNAKQLEQRTNNAKTPIQSLESFIPYQWNPQKSLKTRLLAAIYDTINMIAMALDLNRGSLIPNEQMLRLASNCPRTLSALHLELMGRGTRARNSALSPYVPVLFRALEAARAAEPFIPSASALAAAGIHVPVPLRIPHFLQNAFLRESKNASKPSSNSNGDSSLLDSGGSIPSITTTPTTTATNNNNNVVMREDEEKKKIENSKRQRLNDGTAAPSSLLNEWSESSNSHYDAELDQLASLSKQGRIPERYLPSEQSPSHMSSGDIFTEIQSSSAELLAPLDSERARARAPEVVKTVNALPTNQSEYILQGALEATISFLEPSSPVAGQVRLREDAQTLLERVEKLRKARDVSKRQLQEKKVEKINDQAKEAEVIPAVKEEAADVVLRRVAPSASALAELLSAQQQHSASAIPDYNVAGVPSLAQKYGLDAKAKKGKKDPATRARDAAEQERLIASAGVAYDISGGSGFDIGSAMKAKDALVNESVVKAKADVGKSKAHSGVPGDVQFSRSKGKKK